MEPVPEPAPVELKSEVVPTEVSFISITCSEGFEACADLSGCCAIALAEPELIVEAEPEPEVVADPEPEVIDVEPEVVADPEPEPEVVADPEPEVVAEPVELAVVEEAELVVKVRKYCKYLVYLFLYSLVIIEEQWGGGSLECKRAMSTPPAAEGI